MAHATGLAYLKTDTLPNMWCAGCGNGVVLSAMLRAFEEMELRHQDVVVVTGIGCWGKVDDYTTVNALHTTHGRALSFGTGVKATNSNLHVLVLMGDGDGATIGGNHLIHAARRNINVTAIMVNNFNYGMTGGQFSATTPSGSITSTTRAGNPERSFDVCELVTAAGANYVARETIVKGAMIQRRIKEAMLHPGFSLVEVMSSCTTLFGPNNKMRTPVDMLRWLGEKGVSATKFEQIENAEAQSYFITGVLFKGDTPDFTTQYEAMRQRVLAQGGGK